MNAAHPRINSSHETGTVRHLTSVKAVAETALQHATIVHAAHHEMAVSKYNVRRRQSSDATLKSLIAAHGVLQNLVGYQSAAEGTPTAPLQIVVGRRRHTFVGELIAEGVLPDDYQIPVLLVTEDEAIDISLAENCGRDDMHPADVFDAMLALKQHGRAIEDIAMTYGLAVDEVKRRLKLASVAPRLFDLYRNDAADLHQMMALAVTDDHTAQEHAWEALPEHRRTPSALRQLLTSQKVDITTNRLAKFVGVAPFEKAGGVIHRDLFSEVGAGYTDDIALLHRLAADKLERHREKLIKAEQLPWIDIELDSDRVPAQYGQIRRIPAPLGERQSVWLHAMQERMEVLNARMDAFEDPNGDPDYARLESECDELADAIVAVHASRDTIQHPEDVKVAGAVIYVDGTGELQVVRQLIRPADKATMPPLDEEASVPTVRRRTTRLAVDRLTPDLVCHRTAAIQAELMDHADIALRYLTYTLTQQVLFQPPRGTLASIHLHRSPLVGTAKDGTAAAALAARRQQLLDLLPSGAESLQRWLMQQDQDTVSTILAFCVAASIDAGRAVDNGDQEFKSLAQALKLDMSKWWRPTAANYFSHLPKSRVIEVVRTATSAATAVPLETLSKDAAAEAAERALANTHWLPEALRVS